MLYFILAAVLAGFGGGYLTAHQLSQAEVLRLQMAIQQGNAAAAAKLAELRSKVAVEEQTAALSNQELDDAQQSYIETVNAYAKQLDAIELFPAPRPDRCPDPVPKGADPRVSEEAASDAELSTELDRLVKIKAAECDIAAEYALNAYKFINSGEGCGLSLPSTPLRERNGVP